MSMRKKLFITSLVLIFAILSGVAACVAFTSDEAGDRLNLYNYTSPALDGKVTEDILAGLRGAALGSSDVRLLGLWEPKGLTLFFTGISEDGKLTLDIGDARLTLDGKGSCEGAEAVKSEGIEIFVPMEKTGIKELDFEQEIDFTVSAEGVDTPIFDGVLCLSSPKYDLLPTSAFTLKGGEAGHSPEVSGDTLVFKANKDAAGRSYIICEKDDILSHHETVGVVEMDINVVNMPVFLEEEVTAPQVKESARICDGFAMGVNYNVPDGIGFTVNLTNIKDMGLALVLEQKDGKAVTLPTGLSSGESFRLRFEYDFADKSALVYVDSRCLGRVEDLLANTSWGKQTIDQITFNLWSGTMTEAAEIRVDNIFVGSLHSHDPFDAFDLEAFLADNEGLGQIVSDVSIPDGIYQPLLGRALPVSFESSNNEVLDPKTGKVTCPEKGVSSVILTAKSGGYSKELILSVLGKNASANPCLVVEKDLSPATGAGVKWNSLTFALDSNNNSVIVDLGKVTKITTAQLNDIDEVTRIDRESLTLWVSDDNKTYSEITDYKLLRNGRETYLYGFEAEARYVKAHYTHFDSAESDFVSMIGGMLTAYEEKYFGIPEGVEMTEKRASVKNGDSTPMRDEAVKLSLSELGFTGEKASLRVYLDGELLYHYVDENDSDALWIRVPLIPAESEVELTVLFAPKGTEAIDTANKEYVYEVTYGTRESWIGDGDTRWLFKLPKGTVFPNGKTAEREVLLAWSNTVIRGSYDGGRTWFDYGKVSDKVFDIINGAGDQLAGGFIFDDETGRIFYEKHNYQGFNGGDMNKSDCINMVLYSDDGGKNWDLADVLEPDTQGGITFKYMLSYSDGIKVSSYDGKGPAVDFVFPTGAQYNNKGSFCTRVAYSADGGFTWKYSDNVLVYGNGSAFEGGMSEAYILENEDGVLALFSRCQFGGVDRFSMAYSYDFGLNWTTLSRTEWEKVKDTAPKTVYCKLSEVYTTNTQPLMFKYDGSPIFLWGGNNVIGGASYIRQPLNVAVSYDGLNTWENIQNLFSETPHETYLGTHYITNPSVQKYGDNSLVVTFSRLMHGDSVMMQAERFTEFLYLTKGAYDSFENKDPKYEGWITYKGGAERSDIGATDGKYAMKVKENSLITRSIPYFTEGTISFDLFVGGGSNLVIELQPAFSKDAGKCAALTITVSGKTLRCGNITENLEDGWNSIELSISQKRNASRISVNGARERAFSINTTHGEYLCYVTLFATSGTAIDSFKVEESVDEVIYLDSESKAENERFETLLASADESTAEDKAALAEAKKLYEGMSVSQKLLLVNGDERIAEAEEKIGAVGEGDSDDTTDTDSADDTTDTDGADSTDGETADGTDTAHGKDSDATPDDPMDCVPSPLPTILMIVGAVLVAVGIAVAVTVVLKKKKA